MAACRSSTEDSVRDVWYADGTVLPARLLASSRPGTRRGSRAAAGRRVFAAQAAEDLGAIAGRQRRRDQDDAALAAQLLQRLSILRRWTRDQTMAVHKPLLLLMAFARVRQGLPRLVVFPEIEAELRTLIAEFPPSVAGVSIRSIRFGGCNMTDSGKWPTPMTCRHGQATPTHPSRCCDHDASRAAFLPLGLTRFDGHPTSRVLPWEDVRHGEHGA